MSLKILICDNKNQLLWVFAEDKSAKPVLLSATPGFGPAKALFSAILSSLRNCFLPGVNRV